MSFKISIHKYCTFDRIIILVFLYLAIFGENTKYLRLSGILLILLSLAYSIQNQDRNRIRKPPPEIILFTCWLVWSAVSGFFVAIHVPFFIASVWSLAQFVIIFWALYGLLKDKPTPELLFGLMIFIAISQSIFAYTGVLRVLDDTVVGSTTLDMVRMRGRGFARNPNVLSNVFIRGICSCFFLYQSKSKPNHKSVNIVLLCIICWLSYANFTTGSRKSLVYLIIIMFLWIFWALPYLNYNKAKRKSFSTPFFFLIFTLTLAPAVVRNTSTGSRWLQLFEASDGSLIGAVSSDIRYHYYAFGIDLLRKNVLSGVGLGQYVVHNPNRQVAHSDYIESLANTGIIGFVIYQSMKVVLFLRLKRLLIYFKSSAYLYNIKVLMIMMIFIIIAGFGFHQYRSYDMIGLWVLLISLTWHIECKIKSQRYGPPAFAH